MTAHRPWDGVGLTRGPGRRDRFVCTDNLTGWFEGFTHSPTLGRGYMVRDTFVFRSWSSALDGRPLDRQSKAVVETVYPWGHRIDYPDDVHEELLLHSGHRILSLRVWGPTPVQAWVRTDLADPGPGLWTDRIDLPSSDGLTVHLVFGESEEELEANRHRAREPGVWEDEVGRRWTHLTRAQLTTDDPRYNLALFWAAASAQGFVTQEFGTGLWAGLPWFKDNWGRGTFIAFPGALLCTGNFTTARAVLENFARLQNLDPADRNRGRVPNRVNRREVLYNTVDGTPWLIRELEEYLRYTGDRPFARSLRPLIRRYVDGALAEYVDAEGLLSHEDADTWMDARIDGDKPWSPRGDRAVEIQALWIEALEVGYRLAEDDGDLEESRFYARRALQARGAFDRRFVVQGLLADRVSSRGTPDPRRRPNPLLLSWINQDPPVEEAVLETTTRTLVETLLVPYGILSLDPDHPDFHPRHENPARWHKDAAYHNGSVWAWNAGFTVTALGRVGWQDRAWELTVNLTGQILDQGCVGTLGEVVDALPGPDGLPVPSGTFSQAWSVSEFVRNGFQDYLGWSPDLPRGELRFRPSLPSAWKEVRARLPYGADQAVEVHVTQVFLPSGDRVQTWTFTGPQTLPPVVLEVPSAQGGRVRLSGTKTEGQVTIVATLPPARSDAPRFAALVPPPSGWPCEQGKDVLHGRINGRPKDR